MSIFKPTSIILFISFALVSASAFATGGLKSPYPACGNTISPGASQACSIPVDQASQTLTISPALNISWNNGYFTPVKINLSWVGSLECKNALNLQKNINPNGQTKISYIGYNSAQINTTITRGSGPVTIDKVYIDGITKACGQIAITVSGGNPPSTK